MGGYGNATVIDHGNALATLYGHQSAIFVQPGDHVSRGQVIGAVGCTGLCTGPHLHFEVRVSGTPVDPLPYL
jgi:murein DD-endopeptidase MepM/ murein hydrolase activator NlpD